MLLERARKITEDQRRFKALRRVAAIRRQAEREEFRREFEDLCYSGENGLGPWDLDDDDDG